MGFREQVERDVQFSRTMSQAEMQQLQIKALLMIDDTLRLLHADNTVLLRRDAAERRRRSGNAEAPVRNSLLIIPDEDE